MKRKKIFCTISLLLMAVSVFSASFVFKQGNKNISGTVRIYQNGILVETASASTSTGTVTVNLPAGRYTYQTNSNFSGSFSSQETVFLNHEKLTVNVKNTEGNPLSESIYIYENGIEIASTSSSSSTGIAEFNLKPSENYAYKTSFSKGAIPLTSSKELNLVKATVQLIAKYGDLPVNDYFTIYPYENQRDALLTATTSKTNGKVTLALSPGKYWVMNKLNVFTLFEVTETNKNLVLEYKRVRFICQSTEPNVLDNIAVIGANSSKETRITDGKGYADFYLLPGEYNYEFLAGKEAFTVNGDRVIDVSTKSVTFVLKNKVTYEPYSKFSFKIGTGTDMNQLINYITNERGECTVQLKAGKYVFSDGVSLYPFTVAEQNLTVTPPLYEVTFELTRELPNAEITYLYLKSAANSSSKSISYKEGMKMVLLEGSYSYTLSAKKTSSTFQFPFEVTKNLTCGSMYEFRVKAKDTENKGVSGLDYYIKQNGNIIYYSLTTNQQGEDYTYLPEGEYQLYSLSTQQEIPFTITGKNETFELKFPVESTFTVTKDNLPFTGTLIMYNEDFSSSQTISCTQGIATGRIEKGPKRVLLSGLLTASGYSLINFSGDSSFSIDFISLKILSEGKGLTFPYNTMPELPFYFTKGSVVTLSAIPMKNWECRKWTINGREISEDRIELTLQEETVAVAHFETSGTDVKKVNDATNSSLAVYPNPVENQLSFSEDLSGKVQIYSTDGQLCKDIYVLGNNMDVSDLKTGTYILVLDTDSNRQTTTFIKK